MTRLRLLLYPSLLLIASSCGGDHFSSSTSTRGGASGAAGANGGRDEGGGGSGADVAGPAGAGGSSEESGGSTSSGGAEPGGGRGGKQGSGGGAGSAGTTGKGGISGTGGTASSGGSSSGGATSSSGGTGAGTGGAGIGGSTMPPPHFCDGQQAVLFCDDFDGITTIDTLLSSWTSVSTTGGTFSLDTGGGMPSPPNALRLRSESSQDVQALAIHEVTRFTKAPSKVRLEFDLRIDAADTVGVASGAAIANLLTGSRVLDGIIGIEISTGPSLHAGYIDPSGATDEVPFTSPYPAEGKWLARFALEITYSATTAGTRTGCIQAYIGTARQLSQCLPLPRSLATPPPFMSVALGLLGGGLATTGDVQVRFDNVVVTAE